jgi:putative thiamine transport system ATP-binding protein
MNSGPLELRDVTLRLHGRVLIDSLTLSVNPGEVVTIMGESGCGKSSLLAWLCGTLPAAFTASGQIRNAGVDLNLLPPESRRLGILFQDDLLFPHMSVGQNLGFGLKPSVRRHARRQEMIERALEEAGMAGFGDRDPATLSGGQRARVALLRVLLSEPLALLLDEPFSKLDPATRQRFRDFVFHHLRGQGLPALMVTHDQEDAVAAGGRVIRLSGSSP